MRVYSKEIVVKAEHLDELNHVNNIQYMRWVEDVSKEHWFNTIEGKFDKTKYIWVVTHHDIHYYRQAFLDEQLIAETRIVDFNGKFSNREVTVRNKATNKVCMKSMTKWCLIDPLTLKPMIIPTEVTDPFF